MAARFSDQKMSIFTSVAIWLDHFMLSKKLVGFRGGPTLNGTASEPIGSAQSRTRSKVTPRSPMGPMGQKHWPLLRVSGLEMSYFVRVIFKKHRDSNIFHGGFSTF